MNSRIFTIGCVLLIGAIAIVGCSKSSKQSNQADQSTVEVSPAPDPHDIPLTDAEVTALQESVTNYRDALKKIRSYRDTIRDVITSDMPHKAHRPFDELDVVLEYLPIAARNSEIPRSQWETVNTSAQELRELFNRLHAQIDAGEKADFESVAGEIEARLTVLQLDGSGGLAGDVGKSHQ